MKGQVFGVIYFIALSACTANQEALLSECKQGIGEACNKLGQAVEGENKKDAELYYQKACNLQNTNGCVRLADMVKNTDFDKAYGVLKISCDRGNTAACVKQAELLQERASKK